MWPKKAGAPKLLQDLVDQLALAIAGQPDRRSDRWRMRRRVGRAPRHDATRPALAGAAGRRRTGVVPGVPRRPIWWHWHSPTRHWPIRCAGSSVVNFQAAVALLRSRRRCAVHRVRRGGDRRHHRPRSRPGPAVACPRHPIGMRRCAPAVAVGHRPAWIVAGGVKLLLAPVGGGACRRLLRGGTRRFQSVGVRVGSFGGAARRSTSGSGRPSLR